MTSEGGLHPAKASDVRSAAGVVPAHRHIQNERLVDAGYVLTVCLAEELERVSPSYRCEVTDKTYEE